MKCWDDKDWFTPLASNECRKVKLDVDLANLVPLLPSLLFGYHTMLVTYITAHLPPLSCTFYSQLAIYWAKNFQAYSLNILLK